MHATLSMWIYAGSNPVRAAIFVLFYAPIVYRLGHVIFTHESGFRLSVGAPRIKPGIMLVLKSVALLRPCRLKVRPLDSLSGNTRFDSRLGHQF